jgi:hypothetical protein
MLGFLDPKSLNTFYQTNKLTSALLSISPPVAPFTEPMTPDKKKEYEQRLDVYKEKLKQAVVRIKNQTPDLSRFRFLGGAMKKSTASNGNGAGAGAGAGAGGARLDSAAATSRGKRGPPDSLDELYAGLRGSPHSRRRPS